MCIIGLVSNVRDLDNYFIDTHLIVNKCAQMDLLLNASKIREMLFTTSRMRPDTPSMTIAGTAIDFSETVKYHGVLLD